MSKVDLDQILEELDARGTKRMLSKESYPLLAAQGFQAATLRLAIVATEILAQSHPMTLRGLFYAVVSAGWFPSTDKEHYRKLGRIMGMLRQREIVPWEWMVDGIRSTIKPSSWSGLADFVDTVRDAYRMDFWARLSHYIHFFCEKDALSGALAPVTKEYDVPLSVVRGYSSLTYVQESAMQWRAIPKPIFAYYLGDFDPSGLDLERDVREKLAAYSKREFTWTRLGINEEDLTNFQLFPLAPKKGDTRTKWFLAQGYTRCAELDALPIAELRTRVESAILSHIPPGAWEHLRRIESLERKQFHAVMSTMSGARD